MKAWAVIEWYYDNCNNWENWESFHLSEDNANLKAIEIGCKYLEDGISTDRQWVEVREIIIE